MAVRNISFQSPTDPLTAQIQAQQIDRQQAIADALRSQALGALPPSNAPYSWTQGMAKLAEALAARHLQKKADQGNYDLAARVDDQRRAAAGLPPLDRTPAQAPSDGRSLASAIRQRIGLPDPNAGLAAPPGLMSVAPAAPAAPVGATPPAPQPAAAPPPVIPPQDAGQFQPGPQPDPGAQPQAGTGAPPPPQRGPYSLTGTPQDDYALMNADYEGYMKQVMAARTPTDFTRLLQQSGIDPNSPRGQQLMQEHVAHENYIAPISERPGGTTLNPITGRVISVGPQNIEGMNPEIVDGRFTGRYLPAAGAAEGVRNIAAAKATGAAAGDTAQVWNPRTQQMDVVPKTAVLGGGFAAGPPIGATTAANVTAQQSALGFQAISEAASDAPNRLLALGEMRRLASGPNATVGAWADNLRKFAEAVGLPNSVTPASVTSQLEYNKWYAQYSGRLAQDLGLSGSDARLHLAMQASPNGHMTREAMQAIIPQLAGFEYARMGRAAAAAAYQQQHGAASLQQFNVDWNHNYDPRIYTWMGQGPAAVQANMQRLQRSNPAEYRALIAKSNALNAMGALNVQ